MNKTGQISQFLKNDLGPNIFGRSKNVQVKKRNCYLLKYSVNSTLSQSRKNRATRGTGRLQFCEQAGAELYQAQLSLKLSSLTAELFNCLNCSTF